MSKLTTNLVLSIVFLAHPAFAGDAENEKTASFIRLAVMIVDTCSLEIEASIAELQVGSADYRTVFDAIKKCKGKHSETGKQEYENRVVANKDASSPACFDAAKKTYIDMRVTLDSFEIEATEKIAAWKKRISSQTLQFRHAAKRAEYECK